MTCWSCQRRAELIREAQALFRAGDFKGGTEKIVEMINVKHVQDTPTK